MGFRDGAEPDPNSNRPWIRMAERAIAEIARSTATGFRMYQGRGTSFRSRRGLIDRHSNRTIRSKSSRERLGGGDKSVEHRAFTQLGTADFADPRHAHRGRLPPRQGGLWHRPTLRCLAAARKSIAYSGPDVPPRAFCNVTPKPTQRLRRIIQNTKSLVRR